MRGPLEGIRVLDLTIMPPWAYASLLLAEMGAEVIKIEQPGVGDVTRRLAIREDGVSVLHNMLNRGKKSIALNLKSRTGVEIFYELCKISDVLIEAFSVSTTTRLGIDYERVRKINERLIYCSITSFGQNGKFSNLPAHDINVLALTGALSLLRGGDGKPVVPAVFIADFATAYMSVLSILAALIKRQKTGKGTHIDVSMAESVLPFILPMIADYIASGKKPELREHLFMGGAPCYNVYGTSDGRWITLGMPVEKHIWSKFCEAINRPDLIERQHDREVVEELQELFKSKPLNEWLKALYFKVECISPVTEPDEVIDSDIVKEKGAFVEYGVKGSGGMPMYMAPLCLRGDIELGRAPELGENTDELLSKLLGFDWERLKKLREEKVIG